MTFEGNAVTTIYGNDKRLTFYDNSINISDDAVVNLGNKDYKKTLTLAHHYNNGFIDDDDKSIIIIIDQATLNMYENVTIGPNRAFEMASGVQLEDDSRFNMYGGEIAGCVTEINDVFAPGGVFVKGSAVFTMDVGTIRDCSGWQGGGVGVQDNSNFVMNGGTIKNCIDKGYGGGAVCVYSDIWDFSSDNEACFVMNGGLIEGCKSINAITYYGGGAVYIETASDDNAIKGGEIKNNSTYGCGGGIYLCEGELTITEDAKIYNNQARIEGDDIYNYGRDLTLADISKDLGLVLESTGGTIDGWYVDGLIYNDRLYRWNLEASDEAPVFVFKYTPPSEPNSFFLGLKAAHSGYTCTIEYYIDGEKDDTLTETVIGYGTQIDDFPNKCPGGYKLEKVEYSDVVPAADEYSLGSYTVSVYYIKAPTTKYTLSYESNGGTQYADERYKRNTVVSLDKVPVRDGYTFTGWYADAELTEKIIEIKMTSSKTVYAGWVASTIPDMLNGDDHFAYIMGYEDDTVRPLANISRAETAEIFFRLLDDDVRDENLTADNSFADVESGAWYNQAISTMEKLGIVNGRDDDSFAPDAPITRAEFVAICVRLDDNQTDTGSSFTDIENHWAKAEIEQAAALGWLKGYENGTFGPDQYITRAEAMTIINRMLCRIPENDDDLLADMNVWSDNNPQDWYYLAVQEATNSHNYEHKDGIYERWTELTPDPDWTKYQN